MNEKPAPFTCTFIKKHITKNKKHRAEASIAMDTEAIEAGLDVIVTKVVDLRKIMPDGRTLCEHFYDEHKGKPFFKDLKIKQTGRVLVKIFKSKREDIDAVGIWRNRVGETDPESDRANGRDTLRARFGISKALNAFHASDSEKSAFREARLLLTEEELKKHLAEYL